MSKVYQINPCITSSRVPSKPRRVTPREHCPICDHPGFCEIYDDGAVHCMRIESSKPCEARMGGWWHNLPILANAHPPVRITPVPKPEPPAPASAELRNRIYRDVLRLSPLSLADREYLTECGIDTSLQGSYGSLNGNRSAMAEALQARYRRDQLASTPGLFFNGDDPRLGVASADGLLLAVHDAAGNIARLQSRIQNKDGSKQYLWLSSSKWGGPSSGAVAHVAKGTGHRIYITEGVKKADVCASLTGCTTIGLPGHGAHENGLAALDELVAAGLPGHVVIALDQDSDPKTRDLVEQSRRKLIAACSESERGYRVDIAMWDPNDGKGIDDLLLAGHLPTISHARDYEDACSESEHASGKPQSDYEKARLYDAIYSVLLNPVAGMKPVDKLMQIYAIARTGQCPTQTGVRIPNTLTAISVAAAAERVGVSRGVAGRSIAHLASIGTLRREERMEDGKTIVSIAVGRPLVRREIVEASPTRIADKLRKRCPSCGSRNTALKLHCLNCGAIETLEVPCSDSEHLLILI